MRLYYYFDPKLPGTAEDNVGVLEDILKNRRIKISRISKLNDPFDCQLGSLPEFSKEDIDYVRGKFAAIDDIMGMICFSASVDNVLMWSHYAAHHKGFVLEIDVPYDYLVPIKYSSAVPELFKGCCDCDNPYFKNAVFDIVRTKALDWAYEKEWRMFVPYSDNPHLQEEPKKDGTIVRFLKLDSCNVNICSVFIGLKCGMSPDRVAKLLHESDFDKIAVYKMDQSLSGYSLSYLPCKTGEAYYKRQERIKSALMELFRIKKTN